jgi:hypothetical protein
MFGGQVNRSHIIRAVAGVDFIITLPFAMPGLALWLIRVLYSLDIHFGFDSIVPSFNPVSLMFVNIMGILGVIWALARIGHPSEELARMDALGRLIVAAIIIHAITWGATPVLWAFVGTELLGAALQYRRQPKTEKTEPPSEKT